MMWTRKELKERAKEALKRNYWKIVLVSLIGMLIGGGLGSSGISGGGSDIHDMASDNVKEHFTEHENDDVDWEGAEAVLDDIQMDIRPQDIVAVAFTVIVVLIVAAIVLAIGIALDVLLLNPVQVGINRFMVKSLDDTARIAEVGYTFDHNYKNDVLQGSVCGTVVIVIYCPGYLQSLSVPYGTLHSGGEFGYDISGSPAEK